MNDTVFSEYCQHVIKNYNRLALTGLPEREPGLRDVSLENIFVKLTVVVPTARQSFFALDEESVLALEGEKAGRGREEIEWLRRRSRESVKANSSPPPPLSIAAALQQYRRLVILGAPGSGKTTLLRWLAVTFASQQQARADRLGEKFAQETLPVLLELRRFAKRFEKLAELGTTFDLMKEICASIGEDARFTGVTVEWMQENLKQSQQSWILLLDGLDEIADLGTRQRLLESIEAFAQNSSYDKVFCILTSRFHGFREVNLGAKFQQTEVQKFTAADIQQFLQHWYETAYPPEFQAEAQQLFAAIQANSRVQELAENPLLCTIIAIIYRNNRVLPNRRVELYLKCCEALLDTWERNKAIKESGLIGGFNWQDKLELLMPMAYWFHEKNHGQLAVSEEEVVRKLAEILTEFRKNSGLSGGMPTEQEAREFIAAIRDRSGILRSRGDGTLEFTHRTFQEYLAARYIAARPEAECIDKVMVHLHKEWWREVHLLVMGHLGSGGDGAEKATRLLLTILNKAYKAPSQWLLLPKVGWWFHLWNRKKEWQRKVAKFLLNWSLRLSLGTWLPRWQWQRRLAWHLLREWELVAQGYADCSTAGRTEKLSKALSDFAVQRMSKWQYNPFYREQFYFLLSTLAKYSLSRDEMVALLLEGMQNQRAWVRRVSALDLSLFSQASPEVVTALRQTLQDKDSWVRSEAASSLVRLGQIGPEVVTILLETLQDANKLVRTDVVESLGRLGQANPEVVTALLKALQDNDSEVRKAAAYSLNSLGQASPEVITALLKALQDEDGHVRGQAADSLGRLGQASPEVITALLKALQDENGHVRGQAADSLGRLGQASPEVITALLKALQDKNGYVRHQATDSLVRLSQASPEVITALLKALQDEDGKVPYQAANSFFVRLGLASPEVITVLLKALQGEYGEVRYQAADSLGRLGQASPEVITALLKALQDKEWNVRRQAANSLGQLKIDDDKLFEQVLITLHQQWHKGNGEVFDALRKLLEGKQIPGYRWRSLEERARFWQRVTSPLFEKLLLVTLIGILLWLLGTNSQIVQILGIMGIAFTILPTLLFPPKS